MEHDPKLAQAAIQRLLAKSDREAKQPQAPLDVQKTVWKPVPNFPALEVAEDGRMRLIREVRPNSTGFVQVQLNGAKLSASAEVLHRATWPEVWPAVAGEARTPSVVPPNEPIAPEPGPDTFERIVRLKIEQARAILRDMR